MSLVRWMSMVFFKDGSVYIMMMLILIHQGEHQGIDHCLLLCRPPFNMEHLLLQEGTMI